MPLDDTPSKQCTDCGTVKPLDEFHKAPRTKRDGRFPYCKACHTIRVRHWRAMNPDRARTIEVEWRAKHPEKTKAASARYYATHREEVLARAAKWRVEHPDLAKAQDAARYARNPEGERARSRAYDAANGEKRAAWRQANRERMNAHHRAYTKRPKGRQNVCAKQATRRARLANAPRIERIDRAAIIERDRSICHICGKHVAPADMSLDHLIPLARGGSHTADNLAVAHLRCNSRRGAGYLPAQLRLLG